MTENIITPEMIEESKRECRLLGMLKFFYFISPLGWLIDRERHKATIDVMKKVYNGQINTE